MNARSPLMILIAGPYRSGTGDDPAKMAENAAGADHMVRVARDTGLAVFQSIGEVPGCTTDLA